jgi:hypothetical protein
MTETNSTATAPASDGSVDSAAKRILAAMDGPKAKTEPASSDAEAAPTPNQSDEVGDGSEHEALATDETAPEAELAEGDAEQDAEADAPDDSGLPPLSDDDLQRLVTVKVNGETMQVPLEEAIKGYSRTSDYYQKTQALAEERKAVLAERQTYHREVEEAAKERQVYASIIPAMVAKLQSEMPALPSQELRYSDPASYLLQMEDYRTKQEALRALQVEQSEVSRREQMREASEFRQAVQEGMQKLPELWPEWKDKSKYEKDVRSMWSYAKKTYGYADEELSMTTDPRAVAILNKARLYDELRAKKIVPDPRIERVMKPTGSTTVEGTQMSNRSRSLGQQRSRLKESGRVEDAAKAIGLLFRD